MGESTIRDRAAREGWRRLDQEPSRGPVEWDPNAESEPMRPVVSVIADAYRFADLAMRRGRPVEAQRYLAVAKGFERLNRADPLVRELHRYWSDEEQLLLDTESFQEMWAEDQAARRDPPNPPSETEWAEEVVLPETSAPVDAAPQQGEEAAPDSERSVEPPNPPNVFEAPPNGATESAPAAAPAPQPRPHADPTRAIAERIAAFEALIAGRRADRLPHHDLTKQLRDLKASDSANATAPPQPAPALLTRPCHDPRHR